MTAETRYERLAARSFYDELIALRDEQRVDRETSEKLAKNSDLPWELNPQGYMKWYMAPTMKDIAMNVFVMYVQRIPARSRSGKQLTQGHQLGFVWRGGPGHTIVDEVRFDWANNDLIQVPLRVPGCVVQHFNDSDEDIEIIFCSLNTAHAMSVDRGAGFEQVESCPEWREHVRAKG